MSNEGKKSYFQNDIPHQETIQAHFQGTQVPHHEFVDKTIVDGIIGDMYFHPENEEQVKEGALSIFQGNDGQCYRFTIKNPLQFSLVVDYLSIGVSFWMVVSILLRTKEHTGLASVGSISEKKVRSYAGFVCAINLQQIKELLEYCWTFSVVMDMASHMFSSYLDIQICFFHKVEIHNFHLLAIPMYTHHTTE